MPSLLARRRSAVLFALLGSLLAGGCGAARPHGTGGPTAVISERDFHIQMPATLPAGEVSLAVDNQGPDRHEIIAAHVGADGVAGIPIRSDGLTVDEEALQPSEVGELPPGAPGSKRTLKVKLTPGRYVFFCNMAGHFMAGMHAEVVVQ